MNYAIALPETRPQPPKSLTPTLPPEISLEIEQYHKERREKVIAYRLELEPTFYENPEYADFSQEKKDLIFVHKVIPRTPNMPVSATGDYPILLNYDFAVESYRSAWEEIYLNCVVGDSSTNFAPLVPEHIVVSAIITTANTNTIQFLNDLYVSVLEKNNIKQHGRKIEILEMLLRVDAPKAFDTVFYLLDLTEKKQDALTAEILRDAILNEAKRALKKHDNPEDYMPQSLSDSNKVFLETARKESIKAPTTITTETQISTESKQLSPEELDNELRRIFGD